jgi:hypothetical protein
MTTTVATTARGPNLVRYGHELMFSIYLAGLVIWLNDAASGWRNLPGDRIPWVLEMEFLLTGNSRLPSSLDDPKLRFTFVFLWTVSALCIFLLLRLFARFSLTEKCLRIIGGIVAVAGFPLAFVYARRNYSLPLVEVAVALVCIYLYLYRNWPGKPYWAVLLLALHCAFWSWSAWAMRHYPPLGDPAALAGFPLPWPGFKLTHATTEAPELIYPWLGFLATLAWGIYVRQPLKPVQIIAKES